MLAKKETLYMKASTAFRNATTAEALRAEGLRYKDDIEKEAIEGGEMGKSTRICLQNCYAYYMSYLTGKKPGPHPRIAYEERIAREQANARSSPADEGSDAGTAAHQGENAARLEPEFVF